MPYAVGRVETCSCRVRHFFYKKVEKLVFSTEWLGFWAKSATFVETKRGLA